jgi:hypothetical protein
MVCFLMTFQQEPYMRSLSPHASCIYFHLILLHLIILIMFGEEPRHIQYIEEYKNKF